MKQAVNGGGGFELRETLSSLPVFNGAFTTRPPPL